MKKITVLLVVFLSWVSITHASLEIVEIMYDPEGTDTNREWVKIYNDGDEDIDIIGGKTSQSWRFSGGEKADTLHYINDSLLLGAGDYAILASNKDIFISENSSYDLSLVLDTSMSLNNTSGVVKIWDGSLPRNVIASSSYDSSGVTEAKEEDETEAVASDEEDDNSKDSKIIFKLTTKIITPKIVTEGIPFSISSLTTSNTGKTYNVGRFIWNFGDGGYLERKDFGPFEYVYDYPGDYVINLSYFNNSFNEVPDATDRIILKVIPSDIYISSVGDTSDPYVEIENKSKYEVSLSGWSILSGEKSFIFKDGSSLMQGKKLKLSPKLTGFNGDDVKNIILKNPSKEIVASYPVQKTNVSRRAFSYNNDSTVVVEDNKALEDSNIIDLNKLGANVSDSGIDTSKPVYYILGLILIIGLGFASFLFLKKKKEVPDYVEKGLSAKDMTIIE